MKRRHTFYCLAATLVAGLSLAGLSFAQEEEAEPDEATGQEEEVMEEIVVVVDRSGDPIDVDALRLEQLREQVIKDFNLAQECVSG